MTGLETVFTSNVPFTEQYQPTRLPTTPGPPASRKIWLHLASQRPKNYNCQPDPRRACESLRRACHTVSTPSLAHSFIRELSLFLSVCCGAGSSSRSSSGKLHGRSPRRRAVLTPAQVPRLICASRAADLPLTRRQHRKATRYFEPGHTTLGT